MAVRISPNHDNFAPSKAILLLDARLNRVISPKNHNIIIYKNVLRVKLQYLQLGFKFYAQSLISTMRKQIQIIY